MSLVEQIQSAVKENNVVIGYRKSLEYLKNSSPRLVVIAENIQGDRKREIDSDAGLSGITVETFEGSSKELGVICGKPFPISVLVIKK